jgi:hypothetical protein
MKRKAEGDADVPSDAIVLSDATEPGVLVGPSALSDAAMEVDAEAPVVLGDAGEEGHVEGLPGLCAILDELAKPHSGALVHEFLARLILEGPCDVARYVKCVEQVIPSLNATSGVVYAGWQTNSGKTPSQGNLHVLFLNFFSAESYPFACLVSDCLEVGEGSQTLAV